MAKKKIVTDEIAKKVEKENPVKMDEKKPKVKRENSPKTSVGQVVTYIVLAITLLTSIFYLVDVILMTDTSITYFSNILLASFITLFTILFTVICVKAGRKKGKVAIVLASVLLLGFCSVQILETHNLIALPEQSHVLDFTGKSLVEVLEWGEKNNISIEQDYEYSDNVEEYYIMYQSEPAGTLSKDISNLTVTVSNGPDTTKEVMFPSMIGKTVDDVVTFVEENFFTNVTIDFREAPEARDIIIEQDKSGALARNDEIHIVASLGDPSEIGETDMIDLSNKSLFYALTWCKRNLIQYELVYEYSDQISKNYVIRSNTEAGTLVSPNDTIQLVISKGPKIVVPNLMDKTSSEITEWIMENKLKITFQDAYDDTVEVGKPISISVKEGDEIEQGTMITVVISKGPLKLEKYQTLEELRNWATKYEITLNESYEFSDSVAAGEIIRISKNIGDTIQNGEGIDVVISEGKELTIPYLIGKSKSEAKQICAENGITCSFVYGSYSESVQKDYVTGQSKKSGSTVSSSAVLTLTLSKGIIQKVNVPSLVGMSKAAAQSKCSELGITCNFSYESNYSSTAKDTVTRQSASGSMNQGAKITVYLSKGPEPAKATCEIYIQQDWMSNSFSGTKDSVLNGLRNSGRLNNCPNTNFVFEAVPSNSMKGIITPDSPITANQRFTVTDGQTYTIRVYS